jgi:carbamoyltransferase
LSLEYVSLHPPIFFVGGVRESIWEPSNGQLESSSSNPLEALNVRRYSIPAVTHVDYSARIQTVSSEQNDRFYLLLNNFKELTGCNVLVNTSFNVRGEPIVCTPLDAYKCFMSTELDVLVIGNFFLSKGDQDLMFSEDYSRKFKRD